MGERINPDVIVEFEDLEGIEHEREGESRERKFFLFATLRQDRVFENSAKDPRQNLAYAFLANTEHDFQALMRSLDSKSPLQRQIRDYECAKGMLAVRGTSEDQDKESPLRSCCSFSTHVPLLIVPAGATKESQIRTVLNTNVNLEADNATSRSEDGNEVQIRKIVRALFRG